jgi:signal transduction histidine kinase
MMPMRPSSCGLEAVTCSAVLAERFRLAREIHDTVVQEFAGILLHLEGAATSNSDDVHALRECMAHVKELAKNGLEDTRRMLLDLRPRSLEGASLPDALTELAGRFAGDCNLTCHFSQIGQNCDLPIRIQGELYRVAQEALCNVRKHSRATSAWLSLVHEPGVVFLTIRDNGRGFGWKRRATRLGYGIGTMQERTHCLGGQIEINTAPGAGTEISIAVPLEGGDRKENINA